MSERVWVCPDCGDHRTYDFGSDHESAIKDADGVGAACDGVPAPYVPESSLQEAREALERIVAEGSIPPDAQLRGRAMLNIARAALSSMQTTPEGSGDGHDRS